MFERFAERSRRVMVLAQEEAGLLNHHHIGTEHLLLGLIHEGEGIAAKALARLGVTLEAARVKVEEAAGVPTEAAAASPPFTPEAKRLLEGALREALELGHNDIGTEHLLLGLTRDPQSLGARVLTELGAEPARVRHQVMALLSGLIVPGAARAESSPESRAAAGVMARCPVCGSQLDALSYRVVPAELTQDAGASADRAPPIQIAVVSCPRCGTALGLLPDTGRAGHTEA